MPLGARDVREVQFSERTRGYNPHGVDEFLEQVAVSLDELQAEVQAARTEAAEAQRRLKEIDGDPEILARTLLLAQRTADQAIAEAKERASVIVGDAEQQAKFIVEEAHGDLSGAVSRLERQRDLLASQVSQLSDLIDTQRSKAVELHTTALEAMNALAQASASMKDLSPESTPQTDPPTEAIVLHDPGLAGEQDAPSSSGSPYDDLAEPVTGPMLNGPTGKADSKAGANTSNSTHEDEPTRAIRLR